MSLEKYHSQGDVAKRKKPGGSTKEIVPKAKSESGKR